MRVSAYILLADAAWIEPSVLSYYDAVDTIVACYDERALGWSGLPIPIDECTRRLRAIDRDSKVRFHAGSYPQREGEHRLLTETRQRQDALGIAGEDADVVLQFDCDEIVTNVEVLGEHLATLHASDAAALEHPFRDVYSSLSPALCIEWATRWGATFPAIPGPIAVRPGTRLRWARQTDAKVLRAGWSRRSGAELHLARRDAPIHLGNLRTDEAMEWKRLYASGHAQEPEREALLQEWRNARAHPVRFVAGGYVRRGARRFRFAPMRLRLDDAHMRSGVEGRGALVAPHRSGFVDG